MSILPTELSIFNYDKVNSVLDNGPLELVFLLRVIDLLGRLRR